MSTFVQLCTKRNATAFAMNRNATIVISVIALHVAVIWAVQMGLLRRVAEAVLPTPLWVEIMAPAAPLAAPSAQPMAQAKAAPKATSKVPPQSVVPLPAQPAPSPLPTPPAALLTTAPEPTSAPAATAAQVAPAATSALSTTAAVSAITSSKANATAARTAAIAAPALELPSSSADYLNNPKPPYPALSKRLGEQGKVVVRVWIGTDGQASQASIAASSGFDRLDKAALNTVLGWRYTPGKRAGVVEAMWFDVPVNWVLQ